MADTLQGKIDQLKIGTDLYDIDLPPDAEAVIASLQTNKIKVPTTSGGSSYGIGSNGQVIKSNGTTVYWGSDNNTNTTLSGIAYCSTAAGTAAKTATMPGFALSNGQRIILKLETTSTVANATLNVNSTGAKTIKIGGANTTASNLTAGYWLCYYDNTNWNLIEKLAVDSDVVHKTGNETISGAKYFAFEPGGGSAAYTHKISLQPYESAGANKIVHTNNNGTTNYKLTLPDKNGTIATTDDVASKANDSDVVHKTDPETIHGTKYFAFGGPSDGSDLTYVISLQPHEMAGANKIVHSNGITNYKLTLPDKNGTIATTDDVAAVDDVIEGYYSNGKFYSDSAKTKEITGEGGKIYTDLTSNKTYRWGGTAWVEISASVPTASSTTLGGIKIGHVNDGLVPVEYPVELDSENKAYVSVPIYEYHGTTYGDCYAIDSPNDDYSMQIGSSGFTVDVGDTVNPDSNLLQVSSDKFQYRQSDVMTGETEHLQSKNFKHWHGMFVCPSNTYYYRLLAKAANSGSDAGLCQTITISGTIGGWGGPEQCEFMYTVALRSDTFSTENNIRKTIFRGINLSTSTAESAIASNAGIDIVTHRDSSSGALYVYLRAYGTQKYSQYNIIVTANGCSSYSAGINGQVDVVELPTDENFYASSSGTLVSGSQLLSSTQNQCIEITNKNLKTINGYSLMGNTNLIIQDSRIKDHTSTDTSGYVFSSYYVIGNMQICWGHVNSQSGSSSVTTYVSFPLSFSGSPVVFIQSYNYTGTPVDEKENVTSQTQYRNAQSVRQVTSASFRFDTGNAEAHGFSWIAIGRYKGSGA